MDRPDFKKLKILYLCEKEQFICRTSRVRFHAVEAIARRCQLIWSGPGWENWDNESSLTENIARLYGNESVPHLIFCYKPFTIRGFANVSIPKCVSYNEMGTPEHPRDYTVKEIIENRVDLVVCHHKNEMLYPEFADLPCEMVNISHCAEKTVFRDYALPKTTDVLLIGAIHPQRYPLRTRLYELVLRMRVKPAFQGYRLGVWPHPGGLITHAYDNQQAISFARAIHQSKICLTCSGLYHCRYGKYVEVPACRSFLMADLPDEEPAFFRSFMGVIDRDDSDAMIEDKILYYLQNEEERNRLTEKGFALAQDYTQEDYAERFLTALHDFLKQKKRP